MVRGCQEKNHHFEDLTMERRGQCDNVTDARSGRIGTLDVFVLCGIITLLQIFPSYSIQLAPRW